MISPGMLKDRVDILDRGVTVVGQEAVGQSMNLIAREVPCLFQTAVVTALDGVLGIQANSGVTVHMGAHPRVRRGMVLRVSGMQVEYVVESVTPYPSPHQVEMQTIAVKLDETQGGERG